VRFHLLAGADLDVDVRAREVAVAAAEKTEKLVEAAPVRMKLRVGAEVPFADDAGRVTRAMEGVGDRGLREREDVGRAGGIPLGVILVAEALLVAPG